MCGVHLDQITIHIGGAALFTRVPGGTQPSCDLWAHHIWPVPTTQESARFSRSLAAVRTAAIGSSTRHRDAAPEQRARERERERGMGDNEARGDDFEKKADQKLSGWSFFGNKYEDAADLLDKTGNFFKLAKNWRRAAAVYKRIADCHLQGDSKHEAASAYVEAANCYKKFSPPDAAQALNNAVNLFLEIGRLNMAARYSKDIGEIYQQEQDLENAAVYLSRAADLFDSEGQSSQANTMTQKIAEIYAQLEKYQKATELFEEIARKSINNNLLKYSVRGILLNAGICQLCRGDPVAINNSLERYQDIDPTFSGTREYKLLADLAASMDEGDVAKFTDAVKEFDSMTRLDPWKTTLLLKAKNELKKKEDDEDDLT
ncbi:hypothetical protein GQ55_9G171300 [Panicum hallii var. hallii]|uniref:Uncharacterized protein n=1 Tax=Panicum hallii var. hallii TaxID=1504633 RepID=A0A2T7C456_9POAL|nr:hypothetical protein GQ55_9G171300 [Panicum hallii var. hallii]